MRVPIVGVVPMAAVVAVGCGVGALFAVFLILLAPLLLAHHDATAAADDLQQANDARLLR